MATVRLTHTVWSNSLNNAGSGNYIGVVGGSSSYLTTLVDRLDIYQGTIPSWSSFTDASTRASDLLVTFSLSPSNSFVTSNTATSYRIQLAITGNEATASQSGLATWFMLRNYSGSSNDLTIRGALIGTVGITGTGADLEIPDTSIASGTAYRCSSFYINFPLEFTF